MPAEEAYSNPLAPPDHDDLKANQQSSGGSSKHPLTNADFRKLLTTPRGGTHGHKLQQTHSASGGFTQKTSGGGQLDVSKVKSKHVGGFHKKKKGHFKTKKEDEDDLTEILKNYRDRAKERRDGEGKDGVSDIDLLQLTSGYRAVAHDARSSLDAAERRKQVIQESKYLGGDMEHTHLVKGLDYALLQKVKNTPIKRTAQTDVRSEILSKEQEEEELEKVYHAQKGEREEAEAHIKTTTAKNIYRVLFKNENPRVNEAFAPRRMAYVVELDDDYAESDIPTTLMRSKQECPVDEASTNLSTNDMVIQKLTQVLAYLRTDTKRKKKEKGADKTDDSEPYKAKGASQNIYDEASEYLPNVSRAAGQPKKKADKSYFEKPEEEEAVERKERERGAKQRDMDKERNKSSRYREDEKERERKLERGIHRDRDRELRKDSSAKQSADVRLAQGWAPADLSLEKQQQMGRNPSSGLTKEEKDQGMGSVFKRDEGTSTSGSSSRKSQSKSKMKLAQQQDDSYAECYPGYMTNFDVAGDSDDDTDFTKMDLGNKKGPVKRWDFETEQEYEEYMSKREALPKAAFQYGLKMNDGRKTRKTGSSRSERDEKQKIDRQWNQISKIIAKRKSGARDEPLAKQPKT